jgi:prepilin-type N-terminal cleavage/methylation domain-containing protein
MKDRIKRLRAAEDGFTLIELLIAIVVVGILATVVIVGIGSLTDSGEAATCEASADASLAAANVHYANTTPSAWPADFEDMVAAGELQLPSGVPAPADGATTLVINTQTLTLNPVGSDPDGPGGAPALTSPTFTCA